MARYQLLPLGVYDSVLDKRLVRTDAEWADYRAWIQAGNVPDPMPDQPVVVTPEEVAALDELFLRRQLRDGLRADATVQFLRTHTPDEAEAWVISNVTDLASARMTLSKIAKVVAYLARERLALSE